MRLLSLSLERFRGYERLLLPLDGDDAHLFLGPNGAGKTNLLEAVSVLSLLKSCRGAEDDDLALWGASYFRVRAETVATDGERRTLEAVCEFSPRRRRAQFVSDVRVAPAAFLGLLPTAVFLPQDLGLFGGPPAQRRQFLDRLLAQVSPEYVRELFGYQRALKQRNVLLKRIAAGGAREDELPLWDRTLAEHGARVTIARLELLETLNLTLRDELARFGEAWADAAIVYDRDTIGRDAKELAEEMRAALERRRRVDLLQCATGVGPHRDDWSIVARGRPLTTFASRGQERICLLALLFLQVSYLELRRGEKPVVLLDDVFSELDDAHQSALVASLEGYQTLLTSTHRPPGAETMRLWTVGEGAVRPASAERRAVSAAA